jgi:hypothetical protein
MKPIAEIRELLITSCQKAQDEGWEFINTNFLSSDNKRCCPIMAIAIYMGYDTSKKGTDEYQEEEWIVMVKNAIGQEPSDPSAFRQDSWNDIWQGYDGTAEENRDLELYKLGREIRQLFPAYWEK